MASFAVLGNFTEQGMAEIKGVAERIEGVKQAVQDAGGRMIFFYLTLGRYDFVSVIEVPSAEAAAGVLLAAGARGTVRTETLQAFTEEETAAIAAALP